MIKKTTYLKSLVAVIALMIGLTASAQNSLYLNFEGSSSASDWEYETPGVDLNINIVEPPIPARSGSKVLQLDGFESKFVRHVKNTVSYIEVKPGEYIHTLVHGGSSVPGPQATASFSSSQVSPGYSNFNNLSTTDVSTQIYEFPGHISTFSNTGVDDLRVYPRFRMRNTAGTTPEWAFYFDDVILYTDNNTQIDLVAPDAPMAFAVTGQTHTSNTLSWTEGADALTGVQQTYIMRTTSSSASAPVLKQNVGYSVAGGASGLNTIDDWTVIATVNSGTETYTDNFPLSEGQTYYYAIAHKDLAYNNSDAATVTAAYPVLPVTGVSVEDISVDMFMGVSKYLSVTLEPENAANKNVTWVSSDPGVATIHATNGFVTPVSEGVTTITVTTEDGGFEATVDITVYPSSGIPAVPVSPIAIVVAIMLIAGATVYKFNRKVRLQS